ncbi:hypothetical protein HPB50_022068 [Hyalomma asiaticum]|uniref:Uncharacterized protein n=1 Tax=Hyalomma asiaticum TaxID=266040 RepID=A0ACB7SHQ0_HYAAI|nr:hypothetical protein HPB50_022068 [Hyalomma asiaticum]
MEAADKYCDLLEIVALPHLTSGIFHDDDFIFQQDKSPIHTSKKGRKLLENKGVTVLEWPLRSPDINVIENVWGIIKAALARRGTHGASAETLWKAVQDEWNRLRSGYTSLHHSALNYHREILALLLDHEASANALDGRDCTRLHLAALTGNMDVVRMLLERGTSVSDANDVNEEHGTALHFAA